MNTVWNLKYLYKSDGEIEKDKEAAKKASYEFINKWKDRTDYLEKPEVLMEALDEYETWQRNFGPLSKTNYYWELRHSLDENDPKIKAQINLTDEEAKKIQNDITFFELKISKIPEEKQRNFLDYKPLNPYKHFLEKLFKVSKHLLSEPEEKIMNLKSTTSYDNWVKMTSGFLSKEERIVLDENGKKSSKNFSELMGLMNSQNKKVRDSSAKAFNEILEKHLDVAENELNSVLQHKKVNDFIRGHGRPDEARHIADDIDSQVVDQLIKSISQRFDISQRFYTLKAKLMGVKRLEYHERNVEYGKIDKKYLFDEGASIISDVFEKLDSEFFNIYNGFLESGLVDVFPKSGKRSGAFCTYGLITNPTYILLNWNNRLNDVLTFAHEAGHGINNELVKKTQNALNFGTPTSTAEVASTFMEDFVFQKLLSNADDKLKLSILMMKLNEEISTIFRQAAFYNFETELHLEFAKVGYLSKEQIGSLFQKHMISYMGPSVEQSKGSQNWWVYVNHFRYYFYVYSYAGGLLISKNLQSQVKKDSKFIEKVKIFLSKGLSESPKEIFSDLGVDITNNNFWLEGLKEVENLLTETEILVKKVS